MKLLMESWRKFLTETKFDKLKQASLVGFALPSLYPEIVAKFHDSDVLIDESAILWDYNNVPITEELNKLIFLEDVKNIFTVERLSTTREPIEVGNFNLPEIPADLKLLNYLIDPLSTNTMSSLPISIKKIISDCLSYADNMGLDTASRYCYITIDQAEVTKGGSLRDRGYHIDGMQGTEVSEKVQPDFQFIWSDNTPTSFCTKTFNLEGFREDEHNLFKWLQEQVAERFCYALSKNSIYLMNAYHVHEASKSMNNNYRRFIRVAFTNTPITSVKMSVNPNMDYDYDFHTTKGVIPTHLK